MLGTAVREGKNLNLRLGFQAPFLRADAQGWDFKGHGAGSYPCSAAQAEHVVSLAVYVG